MGKLTDGQKEQLALRLKAGHPIAAIASDLGCSRETVYKYKHGKRGKPRSPRGVKLTLLEPFDKLNKQVRGMLPKLKFKDIHAQYFPYLKYSTAYGRYRKWAEWRGIELLGDRGNVG